MRLVGKRVSLASDVERPTTTRPVVVCGPEVDPSFLGFANDRAGDCLAEVQRIDSPLLSAMILVDCPDPDTQGGADTLESSMEESANRNRDLLRKVLPQCDVMLHVGTAQKYKTASVAEELLVHAPGRQVVFVQTHAARDHDIRDDWKRHLESIGFVVPQLFFVDSEEAIARQDRGEPTTDELQALRDFLRAELAARARHRIRRANALDLVGWWLENSRHTAEKLLPAVASIEEHISVEESRLCDKVRERLDSRLRGNRQLWRSSLLEKATSRWAGGPFAAFLRMVNMPLAPWRWFSFVRGGMITGSVLAQQLRSTSALDSAPAIGRRRPTLASVRPISLSRKVCCSSRPTARDSIRPIPRAGRFPVPTANSKRPSAR